MANKPLTQQKREEMFRVWCERQHGPSVCQSCSVSKGTMQKYRVKDNWDARLKVVQEKARAKLDDDAAEHIAEALTLIKRAKDVYLTSLVGHTECPKCQAKVQVPKLKPAFRDIDAIIRLEEFIRGKPDSRPDVGRTLDLLSDEELQALYDRSCVDAVEGLQEILAMVGKEKPAAIKKAISALIERLE